MYAGIKYFSVPPGEKGTTPSLARHQILNAKDEMRLSVALGQITLMIIHMGSCLGVPLKHPLIFNGHRSMVINSR